MKSILIYGGSFDPPHLGHLKTALAVQDYFHFDTVFFLPCKTPVLKKPTQAEASHRLQMLQLMLNLEKAVESRFNHHPEFEISTVEIDRDTPSYMTETLQQIRETVGHACSITLLLGMDAVLSLPQWHEHETLPRLCNLLVIKREGVTEHEPLTGLFPEPCHHARDLLSHPNGKIEYFDAGDYPISSTDIREKIRSGQDVSDALPKAVDDYIKHHGLYQ